MSTQTTQNPSRLGLRLRLASGVWSVPLHRIHHVAGYAALSGTPEEYFLGWLMFHGEQVPVFDLNRVVCDEPTPEDFGSRILLIESGDSTKARYLGLLAAGATDTIAKDSVVSMLELDSYLPMLRALVPATTQQEPCA